MLYNQQLQSTVCAFRDVDAVGAKIKGRRSGAVIGPPRGFLVARVSTGIQDPVFLGLE
jgi:hypothetical protein